MSTFTITILPDGVTLTAEQLMQNCLPSDLTFYQQQTVHFCQSWLSGKPSFTLQTSGSTGVPKPIQLTREQMVASAHMTGKFLKLQPGFRALVNLNTQYIAGIMMLVRGMELGLRVTVVEPSSNPLADFEESVAFDFLSFVPLQLYNIIEQSPSRITMLNRAHAIIVGGAPISLDLEEALQTVEAPIFHTYGMTETVSHIALRRLNGIDRQDYYQVFEGVQITTDERGCAVIRPNLPGIAPVITNDQISMLTPSRFIWLGRADNVINTGGLKVQAEKIERLVEKIFRNLNIKRRFFVAGLPHSQLGESVTLFIEGEPLSSQTEDYLIELLRTSLTKYELPKTVRYTPYFAETPTGKIDKRGIVAQSIAG